MLTHPDQNAGSYLRFSQDQRRLVTTSVEERRAVRIWDLGLIRTELSRLELDWPAEVLRASPTADQATTPLEVSFDPGTQWPKEEVAAMLVQPRPSRTMARRDFLAKVVQIDPDCANARNELAWLLATGPVELRDTQAAVTHARQAVALEENNHHHLNTLGVALCRNSNYDEAIRVLERSLELSEDDSAAYDPLFLALPHAGKGDARAARDYYARANAWHDSHKKGPPNSRDEFSRLSDETRAAIVL